MEISYNSTQLEQEFAGISNELQNANNILTEMVKEIENLVNNGLLKASESGPLTNSIKLKANKMTSEMNALISETQTAFDTTAQNIVNASRANASNIPY